MGHEGRHVLETSRAEIIDDRDLVSAVQQCFGQMATDKAAATRDERSHPLPPDRARTMYIRA